MRDEQLSRYLCRVLRHDAVSLGLPLRPDGYIPLAEVLALEYLQRRGVTEDDIIRLVGVNEKQRFGVLIPDGEEELHIRAHQGHSIKQVDDMALLQEVRSAEEVPILCHGTFQDKWPDIQQSGLSSMNRNHIHCTTKDLASSQNYGVKHSGARGECDVVIYIDVAAAMAEGATFLWSDNGVVLTRGHDGALAPRFFVGVCVWDWDASLWVYEHLQVE